MSSRTGTAPDVSRTDDLELAIGGMTCASCANRIERKLNKLEGVVATVNYATEKAKVTYPAGMSTAELVGAVEAAGYSARLPEPVRPAGSDGAPGEGVVEAAGELGELAASPAGPVIGEDVGERAHQTGPVVADDRDDERCHGPTLSARRGGGVSGRSAASR